MRRRDARFAGAARPAEALRPVARPRVEDHDGRHVRRLREPRRRAADGGVPLQGHDPGGGVRHAGLRVDRLDPAAHRRADGVLHLPRLLPRLRRAGRVPPGRRRPRRGRRPRPRRRPRLPPARARARDEHGARRPRRRVGARGRAYLVKPEQGKGWVGGLLSNSSAHFVSPYAGHAGDDHAGRPRRRAAGGRRPRPASPTSRPATGARSRRRSAARRARSSASTRTRRCTTSRR